MSEYGSVVAACPLPVIVWLPVTILRIVNPAAEDLFGRTADSLIGLRAQQLFSPPDAIDLATEALVSGAVERVRSPRTLRRPDGEVVPVWVWSRAVPLAGQIGAVSVVTPRVHGTVHGHGAVEWPNPTPVVVGTVNADWTICAVSADVKEALGYEASELVGRPMFDVVLHDTADPESGPPTGTAVGVLRADGLVAEAILLTTPLEQGRRIFALGCTAPTQPVNSSERIAELEQRLRQIGAEVRAAGLVLAAESLPAVSDVPELADLSSRQWEILSRLLAGDRVPSIAKAMYLSQSTVRNHLAAIFQRFGVHSQAELLDRVRGR